MAQEPVLDEIVRRIVRAVHPERVYLFGSRARGDAGPDSDYDLMVLVRDAKEPLGDLSRRAYDEMGRMQMALRESHPPGTDILLWPAEKFDRWKHLAAELPATVLREGRLLYGG